MSEDVIFAEYWRHKRAKEEASRLGRPVMRCFPANGFDDTEAVYWAKCRDRERILDIGAGDNRIKRKFLAAGYRGVYETVDPSCETQHDYQRLDQVTGAYDAILLLDVIEHMPLDAFYPLVARVDELLTPGGVLIISTPNPACIRPMWAGDMTHVQQYPLNDLLAVFLMRQYACEAYRVLYQNKPRTTVLDECRLLVQKLMATKIFGMDYADGLVVVANKAA